MSDMTLPEERTVPRRRVAIDLLREEEVTVAPLQGDPVQAERKLGTAVVYLWEICLITSARGTSLTFLKSLDR